MVENPSNFVFEKAHELLHQLFKCEWLQIKNKFQHFYANLNKRLNVNIES